jgi:hypothetical protein
VNDDPEPRDQTTAFEASPTLLGVTVEQARELSPTVVQRTGGPTAGGLILSWCRVVECEVPHIWLKTYGQTIVSLLLDSR